MDSNFVAGSEGLLCQGLGRVGEGFMKGLLGNSGQ